MTSGLFKRTRTVLTIAIALIVSGCADMDIKSFEGKEPRFVLEDYFQGKTLAWGIFEDRFGTLRRQFAVDIDGKLDGDTLTLDERFEYSDGERDRRVWIIRKLSAHLYEGRSDDIIGTAQGDSYGNALRWRYDIDLKMGDSTLRVHFDDWMFLQEDGVLMNRARVSKWGFDIGEVTLVFVKPEKMQTLSKQGNLKAVPDPVEAVRAAAR